MSGQKKMRADYMFPDPEKQCTDSDLKGTTSLKATTSRLHISNSLDRSRKDKSLNCSRMRHISTDLSPKLMNTGVSNAVDWISHSMHITLVDIDPKMQIQRMEFVFPTCDNEDHSLCKQIVTRDQPKLMIST